MSSHKLQAKNKATGEIVEYKENLYNDFPYTIKGRVYSKEEFNELYECVEEDVLKEVTDKWDKEAMEAAGLEETPDWEKELDTQFGHWDVPTTPIKIFIQYTLQKERERLVREIEEIKIIANKYHISSSKTCDRIKKLIQNK